MDQNLLLFSVAVFFQVVCVWGGSVFMACLVLAVFVFYSPASTCFKDATGSDSLFIQKTTGRSKKNSGVDYTTTECKY